MRDSVRDAFLTFTAPMEGVVPFLYADPKGLVSIGIGNLVDPIQLALSLPLAHPDGSPADRGEIATEWLRVKNDPHSAQGGWTYAKSITRLRMTQEGIRALVANKLHQNDAFIAHRFPAYEQWPADAQMGVMSMCWAVGPAFQKTWPKFTQALDMLDFEEAAVQCFMPEEKTISGLRPRNRANALLFRNAEQVIRLQLDQDMLYWPRDLNAPVGPDDTTQPFATVHPIVPLQSPDLDDEDEPPEAA
jgi:GH24 family phage-related lysozyme (muramidase)